MESSAQGPTVSQLQGYDCKFVLFQRANQFWLIAVHYDCVGIHDQHVHGYPL